MRTPLDFTFDLEPKNEYQRQAQESAIAFNKAQAEKVKAWEADKSEAGK